MASPVEEAIAKVNAAAPTVGAADADKNPMVWISGGGQQAYEAGEAPGRMTTSGKVQLTLEAMQNGLLAAAASRDPAYDKMAQALVDTGLLSKSYKGIPQYAANSLASAVDLYLAYQGTGGDKSFSQWWSGYSSTAEPKGDGGPYMGPRTTQTTSITDEVTAEALIDQMAREMLGRALTPKETDRYLSRFRKAEEQSPQITTTTPMGKARSETQSITAADKGELLRGIIASNPDYEKYQMDTTIMDMLLDDIRRGREIIRG